MKRFFKEFIRIVSKYKIAVLLNILSLSLALATSIVLIIQFQHEWGYDKFHKDYSRIFRLGLYDQEWGNQVVLSRPFIDEFIKSSPHILSGALYNGWEMTLNFNTNDSDHKYQDKAIQIYSSFLDIFNFEIIYGDVSKFEEPNMVIIPESLFNKLFKNKNSNNLIIVDNWKYEILAVYKDFPDNSIIKNVIYMAFPKDKDVDFWYGQNYQLFIKVDNNNNIDNIINNFKSTFKHDMYSWESRDLRLTNVSNIYYESDAKFDSNTTKGNKSIVLLLFSLAIIILLIASVNFNNFNNALIPIRLKSINIQKILGSTTINLRFKLLIENILIICISFLLSLFFVKIISLSFINEMIQVDLSFNKNINSIILMFVFVLLIGFFIGIYPIIRLTSHKLSAMLSGRFYTKKSGIIKYGLVCFQFIVTFVLIMASLNIVSQNKYLKNTIFGFDKNNVIIMQLSNTLRSKIDVLYEKIASSPNFENIGYSQTLFSGSDVYPKWGFKHMNNDISFYTLVVDKNFLKVMGITVLNGRNFNEDDNLKSGGSYIINEIGRNTFGLNIGDKITVNFNDFAQGEIVGFIYDINFQSLRNSIEPMCFHLVESNRNPYYEYAYIKAANNININDAKEQLYGIIESIDDAYNLDFVEFGSIIDGLYKNEANLSSLISLFSIMAILISLVGVLGIVIFDNQQRKREVSIRKVYGASKWDILKSITILYFKIISSCFFLSIPVSLSFHKKWLENFAFKEDVLWWNYILIFIFVEFLTLTIVVFYSYKSATENPVKNI
ncbi:MAG: hypothetical protein LBH58_13255 [Tannerellaceae bacterium]|jgi:putative ABC transport system permease protein|nr:hypothetical protein [Tannerellaceae bacterium]